MGILQCFFRWYEIFSGETFPAFGGARTLVGKIFPPSAEEKSLAGKSFPPLAEEKSLESKFLNGRFVRPSARQKKTLWIVPFLSEFLKSFEFTLQKQVK